MMNRIKEFRKRYKWTQQRLASKVGVAVATVVRWEKGVSQPSPMALVKLETLGYAE